MAASTPSSGGGLAVVPTKDDGIRLSASKPWDESTRPTGPVPDPSRTYTDAQRSGPRQLIAVHDHLRAELSTIRDLVEQVAAGAADVGAVRSEINTMTLRQNNWTLGTYCRVVTMHHTIEDRSLFPSLRRGDPRLAPVIDRLSEEHRAVHGIIERVDRALVDLVNDSSKITELRDVVDLLSDALLSHLSYEERELVEPMARIGIIV
jgi:hypothetical protein